MFRFRIPGARDAAVVIGQGLNRLAREGSWFHGEVAIEDGDQLLIVAQFEAGADYSGLASHDVSGGGVSLSWD